MPRVKIEKELTIQELAGKKSFTRTDMKNVLNRLVEDVEGNNKRIILDMKVALGFKRYVH